MIKIRKIKKKGSLYLLGQQNVVLSVLSTSMNLLSKETQKCFRGVFKKYYHLFLNRYRFWGTDKKYMLLKKRISSLNEFVWLANIKPNS